MASFQVKNRTTNIIYNIKVSEFIFRNTFGTTNDGAVSSLESTGYTSITSIGSNVINTLGREGIEDLQEYEFLNQPSYYLRLDYKPNELLTTYRRYDPSDYDDTRVFKYILYYAPLSVYKDNNVKVGLFIPYYYSECYDYNDNLYNATQLPCFLDSNDYMYNPTFAINFVQKQVGVISPYYYQVQSFSFPNQKFNLNSSNIINYGNCNAVYINKTFTVKNSPLSLPYPINGLYNKNDVNKTFLPINYQKYSDINNIQLVGYVSSRNNMISNTPLFRLNTLSYDIAYSLLFDTESDNNPYPEEPDLDNSSGQSKPNTGGNPNGGNGKTDNINTPPIPTVTPISTGSVNLYQMTAQTFREFMSYLWSNPFFTAFIKLFQDPMQAVISAHIIGVSIPIVRSDKITIGNVTTDVTANIVGNNFVGANFSILQIPEFYSDASDYTDTIIELYIPYHGYVTLNPYEVMGSTISLQYRIDVLTGAFIATVEVQKEVDGTNLNSVLYQYNGNMAYQIPLSSVDYSQLLIALGEALTSAATRNIKGAIGALGDVGVSYQRSGTLGSNVGYMGVKQAYVTILRPVHAIAPNFNHYVGYPYEGYVNLGSCSGLTICREVYINNVIGTETETAEIRRLLMEGVIF